MSGKKIIEGLDDVILNEPPRSFAPTGTGDWNPFNHPDYEPMLQWFEVGEPSGGPMLQWFARLAAWIAANVPKGAERTVCLRKLLEARDCAMRAVKGNL